MADRFVQMSLLIAVAGCRSTPTSEPDPAPTTPTPRADLVADAVAPPPPLPKIGEFVLIRGGERLFARPDDASPRITLPPVEPPFIGPIAAKAIAVRNGFVEVEMLGDAARAHCGNEGYADHLRGFVRAAAIVDVTISTMQLPLGHDDAVEVRAGIAVDRSGLATVLEFDEQRVTVAIPEDAIGRSYRSRPRPHVNECINGNRLSQLEYAGDVEIMSDAAVPAERTGGPKMEFVVQFESAERLGQVLLPLQRDFGTPHPSRVCVRSRRSAS